MMRIAEMEETQITILLRRFRQDGRVEIRNDVLVEDARMIVDLTTGVIRFIMRDWAKNDVKASLRRRLEQGLEVLRRLDELGI